MGGTAKHGSSGMFWRGQMMFGDVQMAFGVGYKVTLSNKFIISKHSHRPDVKMFHHLLYGGWQTNFMHIKCVKLLHHKKALSQHLAE